MNKIFNLFTLGRVVDKGKEREVLKELEIGLETKESEGSTGVANACAIVD